MIESNAENRKSDRENLRVPVKLEVIESRDSAAKVYLGYSSNFSRHGLAIDVPGASSILNGSEILVNIDGLDVMQTTKIPARLVWNANSQCGLQFLREFEFIQELIRKSSGHFEVENPVLKKFYPYINGEDVDTRRYEFFPYADKFITSYKLVREYLIQLKRGQNPLGSENYFYAQYAVADSNLNQAAILSAHKAFQTFRHFSLERRRKILDDIRELLILEKENLLELMKIEGHPRKLAEWEYSGMLAAHMKESLDYYQSEMMKTIGKDGNEVMISVRRPEGVICCCPPKNAACSNSLTASFALLAGNTLVMKPPLNAPVSTIYLWRNIVGKALKANGAPDGAINIVMGNSKQFMEEWLASPYVRGILFFNDSDTGLEIGRKVYEHNKKPILELSGNDFMMVWRDAHVDQAADSLLDCFMGSTQICMVPKKALIHEDVYPRFLEVFLEKVRNLKVGLPSDPDTILSPVIKIRDFFTHLNDAVENGAELLTGGFRMNYTGERDEHGFFIKPTVLGVPYEKATQMKCIQEENFFPLLPVIRVAGEGQTPREKDKSVFDKMMRLLEQNQYGLRLSAWVQDPLYQKRFIDEAHYSGLLRINSRHIKFSTCLSTHGGIGKTGGPYGEMNYVWQKTSHLQGISITQIDSNEPDKQWTVISKDGVKN